MAERLSKPQVLQLIFMAGDQEIVAVTDECIETVEISIPVTENRKSPTDFEYRTWTDSHFECSRLGLRIVGDDDASPSARLKRLISSIYRGDADAKQLAWRLRNVSGGTLSQKLEAFMSTENPKDILRQFVFVSEEKLKTALDQLRAAHLFRADFDEELLIRKVLWRIGYQTVELDSHMESFLGGVKELRQAGNSPLTGAAWKERVRSAGVNLFVYLEDLLDRSLCFATWILLRDHFGDEHYYDPGEAAAFVSSELSGLVTAKDGPIVFDASGKNTLFTLISGFASLRIRCEAVLNEPPSKYERTKSSRPHYDTPVTLQLFPYKHRVFVLDLPQDERDLCLTFIQGIYDNLMQGIVMNVRNRIDHSGGAFPSQDEISKCCDSLERIGADLVNFGLFPTIYAAAEIRQDAHDRTRVSSRDSRGREVVWTQSPVLQALHSLPSPEQPQVIVPSIHVPETAEPLRFRLRERSEFGKLWDDYPKRRASALSEGDSSGLMLIGGGTPKQRSRTPKTEAQGSSSLLTSSDRSVGSGTGPRRVKSRKSKRAGPASPPS